MKRFLLSALTLLSAFVLFADEEIPVNGNFQPDPRSKNSVPRFWWSQHNEWKKERDKVKFALSEEDGKVPFPDQQEHSFHHQAEYSHPHGNVSGLFFYRWIHAGDGLLSLYAHLK